MHTSRAAEKVFQDAADSLWSGHLEVEIAGLRVGTSVHTGSSGDLSAAGEPDEDQSAPYQWALQSCRCLVKVVSSKLGVCPAHRHSRKTECLGLLAYTSLPTNPLLRVRQIHCLRKLSFAFDVVCSSCSVSIVTVGAVPAVEAQVHHRPDALTQAHNVQGDALLLGKRVKVDTDPVALSTDPRQLTALRTALAPLHPPPELLAPPLWRLQADAEQRDSPPATAQTEACPSVSCDDSKTPRPCRRTPVPAVPQEHAPNPKHSWTTSFHPAACRRPP